MLCRQNAIVLLSTSYLADSLCFRYSGRMTTPSIQPPPAEEATKSGTLARLLAMNHMNNAYEPASREAAGVTTAGSVVNPELVGYVANDENTAPFPC